MRPARIVAAGALGVSLLLASAEAPAAGLYFSDRGVRPLGRGGAFVAGADDLGAVYYNPAGLADAGAQVLADMSWLHFTSDYQRKAALTQVDPATGAPTGETYEQTMPSVHGTSPVLPIPTLAVSSRLGVPRANFAVGVWAPYAAITTYPASLGATPAPQRYSLVTLDGSTLAVVGAWGAYRVTDKLAVGAGVEALVGTFRSSVVFTSCPAERLVCAPESPSYDASAQLSVGPIVAPSGNLGAIFAPTESVRLGVAFQLPFWVDAKAKVKVKLPDAAITSSATQEGDAAHVTFRLPWTLRTGIEYRLPSTRVELAWVYEAWSLHDEIRVVPDDVALRGVTAFPDPYAVGPMRIPRGFRDTWSTRLGAEQALTLGGYRVDVRGGVFYERSAVPRENLSVLTVDLDKIGASVGGSLHVGRWRFDGVWAHIFTIAADVGTREAALTPLTPLAGNATPTNRVNAGHYDARADVLGVGLAYQLD